MNNVEITPRYSLIIVRKIGENMNTVAVEILLLNAMKIAKEEAQMALKEGELPFGAVVINKKGQIVSQAHDTVSTTADPTRHAEINAVRAAIKNVGADLSGHTLVCVGEPCAMCSSAAWWSGIRHIAYAVSMVELVKLAPQSMPEPIGSIQHLNEHLSDKFHINSGIMRKDVLALWKIKALI